MRFTSIAAGVLSFVSVVAAQPPRDSPADACCCCDIHRSLISCNRSISKQDCFCIAVVCPATAPTVYEDSQPPPTAAVKKPRTPRARQTPPALVMDKGDVSDTANACCCCDISQSAISCSRSISKHDCSCAAVVCPQDAPVVWADDDKYMSNKDAVRPPPSLPVENAPYPPSGPVAEKPAPEAATEAPRAIPSTKGKPPGLNDRPRRLVTVTKLAQPKPMAPGYVMP